MLLRDNGGVLRVPAPGPIQALGLARWDGDRVVPRPRGCGSHVRLLIDSRPLSGSMTRTPYLTARFDREPPRSTVRAGCGMTAQSQKTQEPLHHAVGDYVRRCCSLKSSLRLVAGDAAIGILTKDASYGAVIGHAARNVQPPCP
jgi:hypothetical protein